MKKNKISHNYYEYAKTKGLYPKPARLKFYLEQYLFKGIDFSNKVVLDIGGGSGLFSFFCALNGARKVVILEPEFDGSSVGMRNKFLNLKNNFPEVDNIEMIDEVLQDYFTQTRFDFVIMHNSINHLNEEACITLKKNTESLNLYKELFDKLYFLMKEDGVLLISDCSNINFYSSIGLKNPIAPNIEWHKHQAPKVWINLLISVGFNWESTQWASPNFLRRFGRVIFGNPIMSYFTTSDFLIKMHK